MDNAAYIVDTPLPLSQDFAALKEKGLAYLQAFGSSSWTNFNTVDPGITILDQVVYALTELGYSNDFPIEDILTSRDGILQLAGQFYQPEEIMTTSPVTLLDYRRAVIDGVDGVKNAVIVPTVANGLKVYKIYLQVDNKITDAVSIDNICRAAFLVLNKSRNLCELFAVCQPATRLSYQVSGEIIFSPNADPAKVLAQANEAVNDYLFPPVFKNALTLELGGNAGELYNGPHLQHSWVPIANPGDIKYSLQAAEFAGVLSAVPGIASAYIEYFYTQPVTPPFPASITCSTGSYLSVDLAASISSGLLTLNGTKQTPQAVLSGFPAPLPFAGSIDKPASPVGRWRDIDNYYPIQNTFPEVYGVGLNAPGEGAPVLQVAQSRQLKGYLTLFDQVLANQFAQLANVGNLLSFSNTVTGAPADRQAFYAQQGSYTYANPVYPVPFLSFSPTYFCQSLYQVPNIKPLLKDNNSFAFNSTPMQDKALEQKSWDAYRQDPYNPYMKGLMDIMEDWSTALIRRNNILDHLLARHGESPLIIDEIVDDAPYSGDTLQDKVIVKSLYLQNFGLLSYYRQKSYNYTASLPVSADLPQMSVKRYNGRTEDFIVDMPAIERQERLTEQDFVDYAAIELKLSLLLGLKAIYQNFIDAGSSTTTNLEIRLMLWMIQQRKGLILIESCLLRQITRVIDSLVQNCDIFIVLPAFVSPFKTPRFTDRLETLLQCSLPLQCNYRILYLDAPDLQLMVSAFAEWHNLLAGHVTKTTGVQLHQQQTAEKVVALLTKNRPAYV